MLLETNGRQTSASASSIGAIITRFQVGEDHVFYPLQNTLNSAGILERRGGMFIGAPVFGQTETSKIYGIPKHGFIRDLTPVAKKEDDQTGTFDFLLADYNKQYPFPWHLAVAVGISEHRLHYDMNVRRLTSQRASSHAAMPFNIGLHPYFPRPELVVIGDEEIYPDDVHASAHMKVPEDGDVRIMLPSGTVTMDLKGYEWLNVWTDNPSKYICVEPLWDNPRAWATTSGKSLEVGDGNDIRLECTFSYQTN